MTTPYLRKVSFLFFSTAVLLIVFFVAVRVLRTEEQSSVLLHAEEVRHQGSRDTAILLLHGLSATPAELSPLADQFIRENYTVIVPLLKGHGNDPKDLLLVTWRDWYAQIEEEYKDLASTHGRVYVGGISLGGDLALLLASQEHDVDGIVTIGAPMVLQNKQTYLSPIIAPLVEFVPHPVEEDERTRYYDLLPASSVVELIDLIARTRANLNEVRSPLLLFQGLHDPTAEPTSAQYIVDHVSSSERTVYFYNVSSHVLIDNHETAQDVFQKISAFIAST